jgi:hypothetical protein
MGKTYETIRRIIKEVAFISCLTNQNTPGYYYNRNTPPPPPDCLSYCSKDNYMLFTSSFKSFDNMLV